MEFSSRTKLIAFPVLIFAGLLASTFFWAEESIDSLPGKQKGDVFFDNVAVNVAMGRGFSLDFDNEWFVEPYLKSNKHGHYDWVQKTQVSGKTTSRDPGFVAYLATIYATIGRNYSVVRVGNSILLAAGLTLLLVTVRRQFGYPTAALAAVTLMFDFGVLGVASQVMSEAIGTSLLAVTFSAVIWAANTSSSDNSVSKSSGRWVLAGFCFGLSILFRSTLVIWLALIVALVIGYGILKKIRVKNSDAQSEQGPTTLSNRRGALIFCCTAVIVAMPWWFRNCAVTGEFAPFGSTLNMGLVGAYSDEAVQGDGNWVLGNVVRLNDEWIKEFGSEEHSLAKQEYLIGLESWSRAWTWAQDNALQLPRLMSLKLQNHLGLAGFPAWVIVLNSLLLFGMAVGCCFSWRTVGKWIALFVLLSIIATMLTWSLHGRYAIPIRPLFHVGNAIGIVCYWSFVFRYVERLTPEPI